MELNELIFLGACAQLPEVKIERVISPQGGSPPRVVREEDKENLAAVRRAQAIWECIVGA